MYEDSGAAFDKRNESSTPFASLIIFGNFNAAKVRGRGCKNAKNTSELQFRHFFPAKADSAP